MNAVTTGVDTIEALKTLIHEQFGIATEAIDPDAPFASYELDSLTLAELMFAVEDHFHLEVPDAAMGELTNLRGLATLLDGLRHA